MALYSVIGADFKSSLMAEFESLLDERIKTVITRTLKQVAHDYDLDYKSLKSRYCSKESLEEYDVPGQTQLVTVDLEPEPAPAPAPAVKAKKNEPKAKESKAVMALSKMKKGDLVLECEERGLDSEGTVSQLKERLKEAREQESSPAPKKEKKAPAPKKEKPAPKKEKKAPAPKKEVAPPPPPAALEEEDEDEDADDEDICQRADVEDEEFDELEEDDGVSMQEKLRKLLAEAEEEEEEYEDE
jgi:hypothetical protein